ncbi:MAG: hypothetical protein ACYSU8_02610, partial [Planctomycetota bacterium]
MENISDQIGYRLSEKEIQDLHKVVGRKENSLRADHINIYEWPIFQSSLLCIDLGAGYTGSLKYYLNISSVYVTNTEESRISVNMARKPFDELDNQEVGKHLIRHTYSHICLDWSRICKIEIYEKQLLAIGDPWCDSGFIFYQENGECFAIWNYEDFLRFTRNQDVIQSKYSQF